VNIFSAFTDPTGVPQAYRGSSPKWQGGLSEPHEPPPPIYTAGSRSAPSQHPNVLPLAAKPHRY